MQRRNFLKNTCRICLLGAAGASLIDMASCSPKVASAIFQPEIIDNNVLVPLSLFDNKPMQIISPKKYPFEIVVEKKADGSYTSLLLKCTHYENQLMPTGNGYTCPAHGSKFDKNGAVINGPAEHALKQLKTIIVKENISIQL